MGDQELQPLNQQHNHVQNNLQQQQPQQQVVITPPQNNDVAQATVKLLLSPTAQPHDFREILPIFSSPLKNQFENRSLWLRLGLTYSLSKESPYSALQAFSECMRIDENDPIPAMLAAKLMIEDFDDPDNGLNLAEEAIKRCQKRIESSKQSSNDVSHRKSQSLSKKLLSRSYLLASIMHALIYEREPESIKQFKKENLESSLSFLDRAIEVNENDYLLYFHRALHNARQQRAYQEAIDNLRKAIKLNPEHIPSMQLLILSLSALKHYDKALVLCESTFHEYGNNLLLLYIKCNLEQCLVETKGYKSALQTAQLLLKCIRRGHTPSAASTNPTSALKEINNFFADDKKYLTGELSVWLLVAEIFVKIGSIEDAEQCVDEASIHASGALSHQVMFLRGLISKARNNLIEAKTFFQSSLALCPRHAKALQQIAHVYHLLGNHSTAEKFLKDSLDVDNDCYKTWHYLSLVYIEQNQHDKAKECVKKATRLEESSPVVPISVISRLTLQ